jgi:hypothetical protein
MQSEESLIAKIEAIPIWRHPFELKDGSVVHNTDPAGRDWLHDFGRFKLDILSSLLRQFTPDLTGKQLGEQTLLDIGCNDGFLSLGARNTGVGSVTGADLREDAIGRANLMKEYYGYTNVEFRQTNIESTVSLDERYDVVLFSGLLYHLSNPIQTLQTVSNLTKHTIVVMTFITNDPHPSLRLLHEDTDLPGSGAESMITRPSERATVEMLNYVGFDEVAKYHSTPFFDSGNSREFGVNAGTWATYVANKSSAGGSLKARLPVSADGTHSHTEASFRLQLLNNYGEEPEPASPAINQDLLYPSSRTVAALYALGGRPLVDLARHARGWLGKGPAR